ncbi:hypothetical protein [uncultured Psychroserpens sp.]|uniref:hypothetical protein n=1 Tax=uncultured Psychroserpens sp. TaxID=255436 RepID=UPI002630F6F7|nr:hypothetical protein [uncultured Psychroserpens sp.]
MIQKLISYLTYGNSFYSVEQTLVNGNAVYHGIGLKKSKNQVAIEDSFQEHTLEAISKAIPKGKAVFLVVNNELVITKKVESDASETIKLVLQAFPNIKIDDFYYEVLKQEHSHFVSICRKTHIDDLLKDYKQNGMVVVDVSLGNLMIASIVGFISEDTIRTSNAILTKKGKVINSISLNSEASTVTYNVNGTPLDANQLINFSSALSLITSSKQLESVFGDTQQRLITDFKEKQFFTQFIKLGLSFLFILLLVNFFLFNNYYDKVSELKETAQVLTTSKTKVIGLNEKVLKMQKQVEDVLKSNASHSSFYANAIITSLPEKIMLSELNYQPLLKKIKAKKAIENDINVLRVSGISLESVLVSDWISKLEAIDWIQRIEIINFDDKSKTSSSFSFKIYINDDAKN